MEDERQGPKYVGFYWTLPVRWRGFTELSEDPDEAARWSKTIRYQREVVRRHVRDMKGVLVGEIPFQDVENDRMTDVIKGAVRKAADLCKKEGATLLWVDFTTCGWRTHRFITEAIEEYGIAEMSLPADPQPIDGVHYDPAKHFQSWRIREKQNRERRKVEVPKALKEALQAVPEGPGRYRKMAQRLNAEGTPTLGGGRVWREDNVRKALKTIETPEDEPLSPAFC